MLGSHVGSSLSRCNDLSCPEECKLPKVYCSRVVHVLQEELLHALRLLLHCLLHHALEHHIDGLLRHGVVRVVRVAALPLVCTVDHKQLLPLQPLHVLIQLLQSDLPVPVAVDGVELAPEHGPLLRLQLPAVEVVPDVGHHHLVVLSVPQLPQHPVNGQLSLCGHADHCVRWR